MAFLEPLGDIFPDVVRDGNEGQLRVCEADSREESDAILAGNHHVRNDDIGAISPNQLKIRPQALPRINRTFTDYCDIRRRSNVVPKKSPGFQAGFSSALAISRPTKKLNCA